MIPPVVTVSISTVNRLCWMKSPDTFFVEDFSTSRLNFTAIASFSCQRPRGVRAVQTGSGSPRTGLPLQIRCPPLHVPGAAVEPAPGDAIPLALLRLPRHLADAEDHEFGRLHRGDADLADHLAGVDHFRRVG